jgi:uncharacterized protein DUF3551
MLFTKIRLNPLIPAQAGIHADVGVALLELNPMCYRHDDRGVAEEAFMRTVSLAFIAFAALSLSTVGARADGSWCANYGTGHSGINCTYTSQQQCLASVSGVYGFCTPNPYPGTGYGRGGTWNLPPSGRARGYRAG